MFTPSPVTWLVTHQAPQERRFTALLGADPAKADLHLAGLPYDAAVIGRKGCRDGPSGIREAFRFLANHDPENGSIQDLRVCDHGDVAGMDDADVLGAHATARQALAPVFARGRTVVMGGDNSLSYATAGALADAMEAGPGSIGIVVVDAHYDLRNYDRQPTSGTPFRRIIEELDGIVRAPNIQEVGIRPYANAVGLADYAREKGVGVHTAGKVRRDGVAAVAEEALERAGDGTEHVWLSIDIDGLDQSIASGCSAPGAGGLMWHEAEHIVRRVGRDRRCRGMEVMEVAPGLDPTGNTCRTAAQLIATYCGAVT